MASNYYYDSIHMFKSKDWDVDTEDVQLDPSTNEEIYSVTIGEEKDRLNVITPIREDIYKSVLMDIARDPKHYQIETSRGNVPRLFITHGCRIVDHNMQMFYIKNGIHGILNSASPEIMSKALKEAVNAEGSLNSPAALYALNDEITRVTGNRIETKFLKALIIEHVMSDYLEKDFSVLSSRINVLSYKELQAIITDLNLYEWTGKYERPLTKELLEEESCTMKELKKALMQELYLRMLCGKLRER